MSEQIPSMPAPEMLEVLTARGDATGQILDKATVHAEELWHRDVHVWITNGRDLLEQQRAWSKAIMPGDWDISAAGHIPAGESNLEAAMRETEEELGLQFAPERFLPAGILAVDMIMPNGGWRHRTVGDNFIVVERDLQLGDLRLQPSEVIGARWHPIEQLETDLARPEAAGRHAPQPAALWNLGIAAMRNALAR